MFFSPFFFSYGQSTSPCAYRIEGRLFDLHDGAPLVDARIELINHNSVTSTDAKGRFVFENTCAGTYSLFVSHPLCDAKNYTVTVPLKKPLKLQLEHHVTVLEEIIVADKTRNQTEPTALQSGIDEATLYENQTQNLASALSSISGVSALQTGNALAKPIIHGMYGSRVGIVVDGTRLQDQEWGADHAPTLDVNTADYIAVVKGAGALRYGGDTPGGVIVLQRAKHPLLDTLSIRLGTAMQSNGRGGGIYTKTLWTKDNGTHLRINASVQRLGDRQAPLYNLTNTAQSEQAFTATFGQRKIPSGWEASYRYYHTKIGILRAAHIGNTGDLYRALQSPEPLIIDPFSYDLQSTRQESQHHNAKVHYFKRFSDHSRWEINYNLQWNHRQEYDVRRGDVRNIPAIDLKLWTHDIEVFGENRLGDGLKLSSGLMGRYQDNFTNPETGVKRLIPDYVKREGGLFSALNYRPNNTWNADLGFRVDGVSYAAKKYYYQQDWVARGYDVAFPEIPIQDFGNQLLADIDLSFINFSYSGGLRYQLPDRHVFLFNFKYSQRAPNPSELFSDGLHHALATIEYGALGLAKERVGKWMLGWEGQKGRVMWQSSLFFSDLKNYIILEPIGFKKTVRGAFPVWQHNAVEGSLFGWDVDLNWDISPILDYQLSSSLLRGQDNTRVRPLIDIPPYAIEQQLRWDHPQRKGWYVSVKSRYSAEQNRYPNNDFTFSQLQQGRLVELPVDISSPPAAFHLWDAAAQVRFSKSNDCSWELRLSIENLGNRIYRNYLNRLRFYADEVGRNFRLQLNYIF